MCAQEGMTLFATVEQSDCGLNENGIPLCYAMSHGHAAQRVMPAGSTQHPTPL